MKVTFMEEIESRKAFTYKKRCPKCGSPYYDIHHQVTPPIPDCYWVQCRECEYEGLPGPTKDIAIGRWWIQR